VAHQVLVVIQVRAAHLVDQVSQVHLAILVFLASRALVDRVYLVIQVRAVDQVTQVQVVHLVFLVIQVQVASLVIQV